MEELDETLKAHITGYHVYASRGIMNFAMEKKMKILKEYPSVDLKYFEKNYEKSFYIKK